MELLASFATIRKLKSVQITFLIICFVQSLSGQDKQTVYAHYSTANGLAHHNVEWAHVDSDGYLWLASTSGLLRFNGYDFYNYQKGSNPSGLHDDFIVSVFESSQKEIWVATATKGISKYSKTADSFEQFRHDPEDESSLSSDKTSFLQSIIEDINGNIWISTFAGIDKIDPAGKVVRVLPDISGYLTYDAKTHTLWIGYDQVHKIDLKTDQVSTYEIVNYNTVEWKQRIVNSMLVDNDGDLWVATEAGIFIYDKKLDLFERLDSKINNESSTWEWSYNNTASIYQDLDDRLWFGVGRNIFILNKYDQTTKILKNKPGDANSLLNAPISGIFGNRSGIVWVTYFNKGISMINHNTNAFYHIKYDIENPENLSDRSVRSIFKDKRGYLWLGTYHNGLNKLSLDPYKNEIYHYDISDETTISSDYITSVYVDKNERLWVGTFNKGYSYADNIYNSKKLKFTRGEFPGKEFSAEVNCFEEDALDRVWIGTSNGLYLHIKESEKYIKYGTALNQQESAKDLPISSMEFEAPNIFWIATWNQGLVKLYIRSDSLLNSSVMPDSVVYYTSPKVSDNFFQGKRTISVTKGAKNTIWLGTYSEGLVKIVEDAGVPELTRYDMSNGFPDNTVFGVLTDDQDNAWASTSKGLAKIDSETEDIDVYTVNDGLITNSFIWKSYFKSSDGRLYYGNSEGINFFKPSEIKQEKKPNKVLINNILILNKNITRGDSLNGRVLLTSSITNTREIKLKYNEASFTLDFATIDFVTQGNTMFAFKLVGFDDEWIYTRSNRPSATYTNISSGEYKFLVKSSFSINRWSDQTELSIIITPPWWKTWWSISIFVCILIALIYLLERFIQLSAMLKNQKEIEKLKRDQLEETHQLKLTFFTNVAHEFKTPLTLILSHVNKIVKNISGRTGEQLDVVGEIEKNTKRLTRLIDQVVEFRKIEKGKSTLNRKEIELISFTKSIFLSFQEIAVQKGVAMEFQSNETTLMAKLDPDKMEMIIHNLLSNALKYTIKSDTILVRIDALTKHSKNYLKLVVKDSGLGIPKDHLDQIFHRFHQIKNHDSYEQAGYGIGLSLTKELVELHNGTIKVESELNAGTTFSVKLPIYIVEGIAEKFNGGERPIFPGETEKKNSADILTALEPAEILKELDSYSKNVDFPKVMVVDDDPDFLDFLYRILKNEYNVILARDGKQALELIQDVTPEIVISDIIMPGMNGFELCKSIKDFTNTSHVYVILMTSRASETTEMTSFGNGADFYLPKPFTEESILLLMSNIMKLRANLKIKFAKYSMPLAQLDLAPEKELFIKKATQTIEENISNEDFHVEEFCHEMGMSRAHLHRKFKSLTDQTTTEFIRSIRLQKATQLLMTEQLTVDQISTHVGFSSSTYFNTCFKQFYGVSPGKYLVHIDQKV